MVPLTLDMCSLLSDLFLARNRPWLLFFSFFLYVKFALSNLDITAPRKKERLVGGLNLFFVFQPTWDNTSD